MIASLGSVAALTAAPLIGLVASSLGGAQHALLVVLVALFASLAVARWVAPSDTKIADPIEVFGDPRESVPAA